MLIDEGHVLIELNESDPREQFKHAFVFKISSYSKLLVLGVLIQQILLDLQILVVGVEVDLEGELIGIVIQIDEAVVQEKPVIAFLSIAIVYLLPSLDILHALYNKSPVFVRVSPSRLPWSPMVQHICISYEPVSLLSLYLDSKDSAANHHSNL